MTVSRSLPPFRVALDLLKAHRTYERVGRDDPEAARDVAFPAVVRQALPLLIAGQLDQVLAFLVERKEMKAKELERMRATVQGLVTSRGVRSAQGQPATAYLLAVPFAGLDGAPPATPDALAAAITADVTALLAQHNPTDARPLQAVAFPAPLHPLAWIGLSLNQRYALLGELLPGDRERPNLDRLSALHQVLMTPKDGGSPVTGGHSTALWPVLLLVDQTEAGSPLEMALDLATMQPESWPATHALLDQPERRVGEPQMLDIAILQGLFLYLQQAAQEQRQARGETPSDHPLVIHDLQPAPSGQGLVILLAQGEIRFDPLFLPFAWLGLVGEVQQAVSLLLAHFHPHEAELALTAHEPVA